MTEEKLASACEAEIEKDGRFQGVVGASFHSALRINEGSTTVYFEQSFPYVHGMAHRSFTCFGQGNGHRITVQRIQWNDENREP